MQATAQGERPIRIAGIILAAGASSRMGRPKQLLEYQGVRLLRGTAIAAIDAGVDPLVVVLGSDSDRIAGEVDDLRLQVVINRRWALGIGSSIAEGASALAAADFDAVAVLLSDQPLVTVASVGRLLSAFRASNAGVVASRYSGSLGAPAVFDRALLQNLMDLPPDRGAKSLIQSVGGMASFVEMPEAAFDVDTPQDFNRLVAGAG